MRKRSAAKLSPAPRVSPRKTKRSAAKVSPAPGVSPRKTLDFDIGVAVDNKTTAATSPLRQPAPSPHLKPPASISDVKDLASAHAASIKRHLELSHSEILRSVEASACRLSKRCKIQTQESQQLTDQAEKEYKKTSELFNKNMAAMKVSYVEFIKESQASASRVTKETIPELVQSMERAIEGIRSRHRILSTSK